MKSLYTKPPEENHYLGKKDGRVFVISRKYHQDLFVIAPFYHTAFATLNRMIVVDVDVEVLDDLAELNQLFPETDGSEVMSVSLDQSGYYRIINEFLIELGLLQDIADKPIVRGLNTGVMLYDLEKMRKSEVFQEQLKKENYKILLESYYLK